MGSIGPIDIPIDSQSCQIIADILLTDCLAGHAGLNTLSDIGSCPLSSGGVYCSENPGEVCNVSCSADKTKISFYAAKEKACNLPAKTG